ncbi:metal-dependent transcriptional regulator [Rufibacter glacialis]|uniref:Transcriptional regulator MntR n=1 Tax=Rufibacter glacialis TaxID=1259555 RepID=A0A5M8QA23_9BACT|nr:metal-dependent transcriptional regulator [Rufibacter glacialis]KAA6431921.1 metal-dependent transcriptional regulator [Rufibacter glacialis]GGK80414.1 iron-dependent repressor [Rufibacter glacialis]
MHSTAEENYIKAIYKLSGNGANAVSTTGLSDMLATKPASVSDMLRKLSAKDLVHYVKYHGVQLTEEGQRVALKIIRKHRLWEVFLVQKLNFTWDEVHEVAEQMEHVKSELLVQRLDEFLGHPRVDPHGDPIPTEAGELPEMEQRALASLEVEQKGVVCRVKDSQPAFLQYLNRVGIQIGTQLQVVDKIPYDNSLEISINKNKSVILSSDVLEKIFVINP